MAINMDTPLLMYTDMSLDFSIIQNRPTSIMTAPPPIMPYRINRSYLLIRRINLIGKNGVGILCNNFSFLFISYPYRTTTRWPGVNLVCISCHCQNQLWSR